MASEHAETAHTRVSKSTRTGSFPERKRLKTIENQQKPSPRIGLGRRCRRFESCHSDQKSAETSLFRLVFGWFFIYSTQKQHFFWPHKIPIFMTVWRKSVLIIDKDSRSSPESLFFDYCDANFEGWRLFPSALCYWRLIRRGKKPPVLPGEDKTL